MKVPVKPHAGARPIVTVAGGNLEESTTREDDSEIRAITFQSISYATFS